MPWTTRDLQLLQYALARQLEPLPPLLFRNLLRREQLAVFFLLCSLVLLLLN